MGMLRFLAAAILIMALPATAGVAVYRLTRVEVPPSPATEPAPQLPGGSPHGSSEAPPSAGSLGRLVWEPAANPDLFVAFSAPEGTDEDPSAWSVVSAFPLEGRRWAAVLAAGQRRMLAIQGQRLGEWDVRYVGPDGVVLELAEERVTVERFTGRVLQVKPLRKDRWVYPGEQGATVLKLQRRLAALGFLRSAPTGRYGQETEDAVAMFQKASGLAPTGVVDPETYGLLLGEDK